MITRERYWIRIRLVLHNFLNLKKVKIGNFRSKSILSNNRKMSKWGKPSWKAIRKRNHKTGDLTDMFRRMFLSQLCYQLFKALKVTITWRFIKITKSPHSCIGDLVSFNYTKEQIQKVNNCCKNCHGISQDIIKQRIWLHNNTGNSQAFLWNQPALVTCNALYCKNSHYEPVNGLYCITVSHSDKNGPNWFFYFIQAVLVSSLLDKVENLNGHRSALKDKYAKIEESPVYGFRLITKLPTLERVSTLKGNIFQLYYWTTLYVYIPKTFYWD